MGISVVIPTLNEERYISKTLEPLVKNEVVRQIIISDGGSTDMTRSVAMAYPKVEWISAARGRAAQMNAGARLAHEDTLLFIHADSVIADSAIRTIPLVLQQYIGGSCYLAFDREDIFLKFYSLCSKLNLTLFTYGDQGLFLRRDTFFIAGGFSEIPIMEDYDMVRRLKRRGHFQKLEHPMTTSSRRFRKNGVVRQQLLNIALVLLYELGFSPSFISRFYRY